MSVFIKICGLRDAETVAAVANAGADAVGFVFAKSVRRVSPRQARDAVMFAPKELQRVAVMRHPSEKEWQEVLEEFEPDVLQTDAEDFVSLDIPDNVERWPVFREGGSSPDADVFVYEGATSGVGEAVDWALAAEHARQGRMILAGGLAAVNVGAAIRTVNPWGVDVSSGVEQATDNGKPRKDAALVARFVAEARAAQIP